MTKVPHTTPKFRLSPHQAALWQQGLFGSNLTLTLQLSGLPDRNALRSAAEALDAQHEILRTRIVVGTGSSDPAQVIDAHRAWGDIPTWLGTPARPWELALRPAGEGAELTIRIDVFCGDRWTLASLACRLAAALDGEVKEATSELLQYADVASAFRTVMNDPKGQRHWQARRLASSRPRLREALASLGLGGPSHVAALDAVVPTAGDLGDFARLAMFIAVMHDTPYVELRYRDPGLCILQSVDLLGPTARALPIPLEIDGSRPAGDIAREIEERVRTDLEHAMYFGGMLPPPRPGAPVFQLDAAMQLPAHIGGAVVTGASLVEPDIEVTLRLSAWQIGATRRLQLDSSSLNPAMWSTCLENFPRWLGFLERHPRSVLQAFEWRLDDLVPATSPNMLPLPPDAVDPLAALRGWALKTPRSVALVDESGEVDFASLADSVVRCAEALQQCGADAGRVVALQLHRGRGWFVHWLACWHLGAVPMPVATSETPARLQHMCRRAGAVLLVTDMSDASPGLPPPISSAKLQALADTAMGKANRAPANASSAAYVLVTSGSTGEPKATVVSHGALWTYLRWAAAAYASEARGGTIVHSELSFDFTQTCLWLPVLAGEVVRFAAPGLPVEAVLQALARGPELSFVKLTPAHLQAIGALESMGAAPARWPRHVVVGGAELTCEMLPASLRASEALVHNEYGPTEATVGCCRFSAPARELASGAVPIGRACLGTTLYVLNPHGSRVLPGETGELFIGGNQLADGYVGSPAETAERFLSDPFSTVPGARMYRTGDLVRRLDQSNHVFVVRYDGMVKRNGFRIEPGEITACLLRHPDVSLCHTLATAPGDRDPELVSVVVMRRQGGSDLRAWVARELPPHLHPNRIVVAEDIPLTRQGKVDESRLRGWLARDDGTVAEVPLHGTCAVLAGIWRAVLGERVLRPDSNFFAEGGDSIRAISVAVRARRVGLALGVDDLFAVPVLQALADLVSTRGQLRAGDEIEHDSARDLPPGAVDVFGLSSMQLGMIYQNQAHGRDGRYHDIFSYRLRLARFDERCLREATRLLVQRHAALRTSFDLSRLDEPRQIVWENGPDLLSVSDLSGMSEAVQRRVVNEWIEAERLRGFDVSQMPLVRFMAHRLSACEIQFTTSFHHAVLDGWSDQQIHTELFEDYSALCRDQCVSRPRPVNRYGDFVAAERRAATSADTARFWDERLRDWSVTDLGPERASGGVPVQRVHLIRPSQSTVAELRERARQARVSMSTLLLAAHIASLRVVCGQRDILTCTVANVRLDEEGAEAAVGLYINTLPVGARVGAFSWRELVAQIDAWQQAAAPHRRMPYAEIQRRSGHPTLSATLFYFTSFHNCIRPTDDLQQLEKAAHEVTSFPLTASFNLDPVDGNVSAYLSLDGRYFTLGRAEQTASIYGQMLDSVAAGLDLSVPSARTVASAGLAVLRGPTPQDVTPGVIESFVSVAGQDPHRLAVETADGTCTYDQLDRWSRSVAASLACAGVEPEACVGIRLPRSARLVATVLGVLRAGASFTVLDPGDPAGTSQDAIARLDALIGEEDLPETLELPEGVRWIEAVQPGEPLDDAAQIAQVPSPDRAAYRMFTSGSTGKPKCIVVCHGALANVLAHFRREWRVVPVDRVLLTSALTFDISLLEMLLPLTSGATLVLIDRGHVMNPSALSRLITTTGATVVQATPSLWALLRAVGWNGSPQVRAVSGGEALSPYLADWLVASCAEAWNVYGPTETTIWSTSRRLSPGAVSIGTPIRGTTCYLLDTDLEPVARGAVGELYIGGMGIGRGYDRAGSATAEAFVPDHLSGVSGARMYRTGDRALVDDDGQILYLGRDDRQVKVAGHRLELGEVETHLAAHPAVAAAVVTVVTGQGPDRLAAYLVPRDARRPPAVELRAALAQHLAPYALPAHYIWIDDIPRTRSGKLDLAALPTPVISTAKAERAYATTRPVEHVLQRLWERVLHQQHVGLDDDFGALGGYSLNAIQIVAQIRSLLGVEVSAAAIFAAPTVSQLANNLYKEFPDASLDEKAQIIRSIL